MIWNLKNWPMPKVRSRPPSVCSPAAVPSEFEWGWCRCELWCCRIQPFRESEVDAYFVTFEQTEMPSNSSNFVGKVTVNKPASSFSTQIISFPIVGLGNKKLLLHNLKVQLWFTLYMVLLMSLLLLAGISGFCWMAQCIIHLNQKESQWRFWETLGLSRHLSCKSSYRHCLIILVQMF